MATAAHPQPLICFGPFELDAANAELRKGGISVKIHPQPLQVLLLLAGRPKQIVTREEIRSCLWGGNTFVDFERGINSCVNQIRAALGDDPEKPRYVETIPRRGYRFIAPVTNREHAGGTAEAHALIMMRRPGGAEELAESGSPGGSIAAERPAATAEFDSAPKQQPWLAIACIAAMISIAGAAWWFTERRGASLHGLTELKQVQLTANSSENAVTSGAISPDGKYLAYTDTLGIHIKLMETGETRDIAPPESLRGMQVSWSIVDNWARDGSRVIANAEVAGMAPSIWSVPVMVGAPRKLRENATAGSVSQDGLLVAFTSKLSGIGDDRELWSMSVDGERAQKISEVDENSSFTGAEWSPHARRIAYVWTHQYGKKIDLALESRDLLGGAASVIPTWVWDFSWARDGRLIYSLDEAGPIGESCNFWGVRVDEKTGQPLEQPQRLTHWAGFCMDSTSMSGDGKRLAFRKWAYYGNIYTADLDGSGEHISAVRRLTLNEGRNYPSAWTADSSAVIFGAYRDGQWGIFKQRVGTDDAEPIATVADAKNLSPYGLDDIWSASARLSPDGAWVLYFVAPKVKDAADPYLAPARLMRVPVAGGNREQVLTARTLHRPACARAPVNLCVISEKSADMREMIFTAFDPVGGRGKELARFAADPEARFPNDYFWDLSPDGGTIAILQSGYPSIHFISLNGGGTRTIEVKGWEKLWSVNWAVDGRAVYVGAASKRGPSLLRVDLRGAARVIWEQRGTSGIMVATYSSPWAVASPDGKHLAIYEWSLSGNMWMMENF